VREEELRGERAERRPSGEERVDTRASGDEEGKWRARKRVEEEASGASERRASGEGCEWIAGGDLEAREGRGGQ
jgi:hypothetical protein